MPNDQPPAAALIWAASIAGPGASARVTRRLAGGTHASTHLLATTAPDGEMVLRRYPPGDDAASREASVLTALDGLDGWAPRLLAVDASGERFDQPATLMTRLTGWADITSYAPSSVAEQLAQTLARLHATPVERLAGLRRGLATTAARASGPAAGVIAAHVGRMAGAPAVLTHFDYWSGNVLWQDGRLTGVIDWSGAALAPRGHDVSWCRLDLVLLYGEPIADTFLDAYEAAAGLTLTDSVLWDLHALANSHSSDGVETWVPNYRELGRSDLTSAELRRRHTAWTQRRLAAADDIYANT